MELVWNKADTILELDGLTIIATPSDYLPFNCQVSVEEQDTHLLLGQQTILTEPCKPAWFLANILETEKIYTLGSVVSKRQAPQFLLAVVHDIEQEPTCRSEVVKQAYNNVLQIVQKRQLISLAMPLLGTVHGNISVNNSILLLKESLVNRRPVSLRRLCLMLPTGSDAKCLQLLA